MQNLGVEGQRIFWCPTCGSVKSVVGEFESVSVPLLATRVKSACEVADRKSLDGVTQVEVLPEPVWAAIAECVGERTR